MAADDAASSEKDVESRSTLEYAVFALALFAAMLAVTTNNADADLWGHVQYGRDMLAAGKVPATTTYSYTAENFPWINHEILAELTLAFAADYLGPVPMVIIKTLLGAAILMLIVRVGLRRGAGLASMSLVVLIVAINLTFHWTLRPQLFSYTFFTLLLWLLGWCFQGWEGSWKLVTPVEKRTASLQYSSRRLRWLWLLVPLMIAWSNAHGGFVAGYCVIVAYFVLRSIEVVSIRGAQSIGLLKRFAMMVIAAGLATMLNPYGPRLHLWLFSTLIPPCPEISEWHPPSLDDPLSQPFWLLLTTIVIVLAATRRSRDFTHLMIFGLLIWQALSHQRHAAFVAIAFGFWTAPHVDSVFRRCRCAEFTVLRQLDARPAIRRLGVVVSCLLAAWIGWRMSGRMSDLTVFRREYPISAVQYMMDHKLQGNVVVAFDWAQYVLAALGARDGDERGIRVAVDGRYRTSYPQEVLDMHFDFALGNFGSMFRYRSEKSGRFDPARVLSFGPAPFGPPDLVLINTWQPHALQIMKQNQQNWILLYRDDVAQLWGRTDVYDNPLRGEYIGPFERQLDVVHQTGSVTWPALPKAKSSDSIASR
jgi:hypothetical protein